MFVFKKIYKFILLKLKLSENKRINWETNFCDEILSNMYNVFSRTFQGVKMTIIRQYAVTNVF